MPIPHGGTPKKEYLIFLNKSEQLINLDGWKIIDKQEKADVISGKTIQADDTLRINLSGQGHSLATKGGNITLVNKQGLKVVGVSYTKEDASHEGEVIEL